MGINDGGELVGIRRRGDLSMVEEYTYPGHSDAGTCIAMAPSRNACATSSLDGSVRIWSISSSTASSGALLLGHSGPVHGVAWGTAGILSASEVRGGEGGWSLLALFSPSVCLFAHVVVVVAAAAVVVVVG